MSAVQVLRLYPNEQGIEPASILIDMGHYRDAKIQIQSEGNAVNYVLAAAVVEAVAPGLWPVVLAQGEVNAGSAAILHVNTYYPKLRLSVGGDVGALTVWLCLSDRMQN